MKRKLFLVATFWMLLGAALLLSLQMSTANALVPSIVSVTSRDVGSTAWVDVVIIHQPPPEISSSHYVSMVELTVNGATVELPQSPQSAETFTVSYSLGPNTNSYTVSARALCTLHGYSSTSSPVVIPEYISAVLLIVLATITLIVGKKTMSKRGSAANQ